MRKRKRGRGRGKFALSYRPTGCGPGRPRKVKTIIKGPKEPKIHQTGATQHVPVEEKLAKKIWIDSDVERKRIDENSDVRTIKKEPDYMNGNEVFHERLEVELDFREDSQIMPNSKSLKEVQDLERTPIESKETFKRKLPPRNRGAKYKKMIQAIKKQEFGDDDFDCSDDETSEKSKLPSVPSRQSNAPTANPKDSSTPKKRGRPRKNREVVPDPSPSPFPMESGGTKIIQLSENLKPIHSLNSPTVLIKDENSEFDCDAQQLQHKLVITFAQPETGEMVMQHIDIQPPGDDLSSHPTEKSEDKNTNIVVVPSNDDCFDEDDATIFVEENGQYEEGYQCKECGEMTHFKRDHIRHLRLKHNLRPYECEQCKKTFTSKTSLQHHYMTHDLAKPHRCNHCGKGFDSASELKQHTFEHIKGDSHDCFHCGKAFPTSSALQSHMNIAHDASEHRCLKCNESVPIENLAAHHSACLESSKSFVCDICELQFVSSSGLNRHRKVHSRSSSAVEGPVFRCSTCQASFSYESSLLKHVRMVHETEADEKFLNNSFVKGSSVIEQLKDKLSEGYMPKTAELYDVPNKEETMEQSTKDPFKCGICNEPFKDIDILNDHYSNSHTGDQPLYCNLCSVGCSSEHQQEQHKLIHSSEEKLASLAVDSEDTPYVCTLCGRGFKTAQESAKHAKAHTQEKQYKCKFCSASFLIKSALDKHILVHTGQRPYVCDICLKSFRQSAALVRHKIWTHRLKNQNKCELCGKTFFTRSLLLYHLDSHGDEAEEVKHRLINSSVKESESEKGDSRVTGVRSHDGSKKKTCEYCNKSFSSMVALLTHKITHKLSASYKCDMCHRTFREKRYLKKHKLTHKGLKIWKCDICAKSFATKLTLIRHSHVHIREALRPDTKHCFPSGNGDDVILEFQLNSTLPNELKCEECNLEFAHKSHYVRHKLLHSGVPLLKCGLCEKMFVHKSDIIRHKVMHSFMFTCNICGRNYHKRSLYVLHMKKHMDAKPFKCKVCNKGFASSGNFKIHQRIHSGEKPFHCNKCPYRCSQSGRLMKHKQTHTQEKTASCETCNKSFSSVETLKAHQRVHTGERPFSCNVCEKSFTNSASLSSHMRDHVKEEMFKCDQCEHKFKREEHLAKHKLFHKVEQLHKNSELGMTADPNIYGQLLHMCDICGRVFEKKKYLYTHHNVHSRQNLFTCSICGKHLTSRVALKNHAMIHTGEMPHKCKYCEKEFRSHSNVKRHEKVHLTQDKYTCEECGETLCSEELLNEHKQAHVNIMMMNSEVENVSTAVSQQLYVFEGGEDSLNEAMDPTHVAQQLIVENSQQQFLVENPPSLLVFPEGTNDEYSENQNQNSETEKQDEPEGTPPSPPVTTDEETENENHSNTQQTFILPEKIEPATITMVEAREVDKPHQCDVCFKYFAKKQYLTKHKYRHREVKPHQCDICGKRFAQKFEVAVHKIRHTGERPYQCEICRRQFRSKVNLINHRMRHTGEYPYLCSVCNKGLSTQLQLERHVSIHTGAHPFRCDMCNKGYFQRVSLIKHLAKEHNIHAIESNYDPSQTLETSDNMEVIEAISTIANIPQLNEEKHSMVSLVRSKKIKEEVDIEVTVDSMQMASMEELGDAQFSVVPEQQDYLLGGSQEIDAKFLNSILQQVRVDEAECVTEDPVHASDNETEVSNV